jgi:hypothetical protein
MFYMGYPTLSAHASPRRSVQAVLVALPSILGERRANKKRSLLVDLLIPFIGKFELNLPQILFSRQCVPSTNHLAGLRFRLPASESSAGWEPDTAMCLKGSQDIR